MKELIDEDNDTQIEEWENKPMPLFVLDITPMRSILYTSTQQKHEKYTKSKSYQTLSNVKSKQIGGILLFRFVEENRIKKIRIPCNNRQMQRKMDFFCDFDVWFHGFVANLLTIDKFNSIKNHKKHR